MRSVNRGQRAISHLTQYCSVRTSRCEIQICGVTKNMRTLEVVRGNVQSSPSGTRASFANIVCNRTLWTATSGNSVNVASDGSTYFQVVSIVDPDNTLANPCSNASYKPQ